MKTLSSFAILALASVVGAQEFVSDSILVKFRPGSEVLAAAANLELGSRVRNVIDPLDISVIRLNGRTVPQALAFYRGQAFVEYAEPNYKFKLLHTPNDPRFGEQYQFRTAKFPQGWDLWRGATTTTIAVIDTGVDLQHEEFAGKLVPGFDFSDNDNDPDDNDGHGTHCAGNAAAGTNNGKGGAGGGYNCKVMPLKIFPNATSDVIIAAWRFGADNGARVFSMSFGRGGGESQAELDALNYAQSKGVALIAAAGNGGSTNVLYPAKYANVLAVGAVDQNDQRAGFSEFGPDVEVTAGGVNTLSTFPGGYGGSSGTSMSCPVVAGLAGLIASRRPTLTGPQILNIIKNTADPVGSFVTHGRINALKAMQQTAPPVGVNYVPTAISMSHGRTMSGAVANVQTSNDRYVSVQSTTSNVGSMSGALVTIPMTGNRNRLLSLDLNVEGHGVANATGMVYVYNWTTGAYDYRGAFALTGRDSNGVLRITEYSKYLSSGGTFRAIIRAHVPSRFGANAFSLNLDFIRLSAQFSS